ncbi:MAG: hypothetical protein DMF54_16145 [Acidobacteria bacterium]|nr:MAG: hypothetical protein DMF54_16145 [Acidobacteriota bacterium]
MFIFLSRLGRLLVGIAVVIGVTSIIGFNTLNTVPVASHNASHGGGTGTSTLNLALLNSTDGLPHYGQQITFTVSTEATTEPHVSVACSQNGIVVYRNDAGYYASYPWPWNQTMTLSSYTWSSGAADCTASLYYFSGSKTVTLKTLSFHVYA